MKQPNHSKNRQNLLIGGGISVLTFIAGLYLGDCQRAKIDKKVTEVQRETNTRLFQANVDLQATIETLKKSNKNLSSARKEFMGDISGIISRCNMDLNSCENERTTLHDSLLKCFQDLHK